MTVEEARDLVELVEIRARLRVVRPGVVPWPDDGVRRRRAALLHPERGIDVRVVPAADVEDRRLDRVVVGGERPLPPVRPVDLVPQPGEQPRWGRLQPRQPDVTVGRTAWLLDPLGTPFQVIKLAVVPD